MAEENRKVEAILDVAQHQQRDEDNSGDNQQREQSRFFTRLQERQERAGLESAKCAFPTIFETPDIELTEECWR